MDKFTVFPNTAIKASGPVSGKFLSMGIDDFTDACRLVHELPYGYNTDRDDLMILLNRDYHRNIKTLNVGLNGAGFELKYIDIITYSS
jgi:hypothetical protein